MIKVEDGKVVFKPKEKLFYQIFEKLSLLFKNPYFSSENSIMKGFIISYLT